MNIDSKKIYDIAIAALNNHNKFLTATEKNLSYYFFGREAALTKKMTYPQIDLVSALHAFTPEAYNPMAFFVSAFVEELANSDLRLSVTPVPVGSREPYDSFADQLEDHLLEIHRRAKRDLLKKAIVFELLAHGFFGFYSNGRDYWFLTAYDLIPGDQSIALPQNQPFWIRRTTVSKSFLQSVPGIDWQKEELHALKNLSDLDVISLLDVWIKDLDVNICFTASGQKLYQQSFPYPKIYPFFVGRDSELANNFYSKPLMSTLRLLLPKYQKAVSNIEEHSKSVANPILTYDADAGIDANRLQRALKEGWKRIIVGKNREGDIGFKAPGHLPAYALQYPDLLINHMQRHLGISDAFLGLPTKAIRERGAISAFIRTSFRKLRSFAGIIEKTFTDLDNYLLEYVLNHKLSFKDNPRFKNLEEIFQPGIRYVAEEKFKGFWSEDTRESRQETIIKTQRGLISKKQGLKELGYNQPRKVLEEIRKEREEEQQMALRFKQQMAEKPRSFWDEITARLKGQVKKRFYLYPMGEDRVLIKCSKADEKTIGFLLSDFADRILIEPMRVVKQPWPSQSVPKGIPTTKEIPAASKEKTETEEKKESETRGQKRKGAYVPPFSERKESFSPEQIKSQQKVIREAIKKFKQEEELPKKERSSSPPFSENLLRKLIKRTTTLKNPAKFLKLPGLYLVEPHAKWIATGKKLAILKGRKYDIVDKPHLLCGKDKVYGVIIVRYILENFDPEKTEKFHLVSKSQRKKWWKDNKLYLYLFEFHPFPQSITYKRPQGVQTFIRHVEVPEEEIGVPFTGDLKPITIRPKILPPPHKPEKRAFKPQEVFNVDRLMELVPEGVYDVSYKVDGLRARAWVVDRKASMYSDTGNKFSDDRVKPLLEALPKIFKHDVLLDGELVMEGIRRKDVAGYIHGKWKPTPEQLKSLRYVIFDILYVKNKSIANRPFRIRSAVLDLYLKKGCKGPICRVKHMVVKRKGIPKAVKQVSSEEGVVIRDIEASYWATHSTYKCKYMFDVDARVIAVEKTKVGLPIFHCVLRDGTYIGQTYAQSEVKAKPGDVIRVNVEHVSIRPDGSIGWYAPRPRSWKEGKITPKKISTTQVGIGGPDTLDLIKEIYLASGGTEQKWKEWYSKHLKWKKEVMPKLVERIKEKIKAGTSAAKT